MTKLSESKKEKVCIEHEQKKEIELMKYSADLEKTALVQSFILNGGALVAVAAFAGNALAKSGSVFSIEKHWLIAAVLTWGVSLFLATLAIFLSKLSQHHFLKSIRGKITYADTESCEACCKKENGARLGQSYRFWSDLLLMISIVGFLLGITFAGVSVWHDFVTSNPGQAIPKN